MNIYNLEFCKLNFNERTTEGLRKRHSNPPLTANWQQKI